MQRWRSPATDLAGDGDDREVVEAVDRPDGADGVVAVHDRHHDVHQDDVDVGRPLERWRCASAPLSATMTSAWPRSSSAVIAKMLRKSSSTTRIFSPSMALSSSPFAGLAADASCHRLCRDRLSRTVRLGRTVTTRRPIGSRAAGSHGRSAARARPCRPAWDVVVGAGVEAALALAGRRLAGDGDDRQRLNRSMSRIARMVSYPSMTGIMMSIRTMSMSGRPLQGGECLGAALDDRDVGVPAFEERRHARRCCGCRRRRRGSSRRRSGSPRARSTGVDRAVGSMCSTTGSSAARSRSSGATARRWRGTRWCRPASGCSRLRRHRGSAGARRPSPSR